MNNELVRLYYQGKSSIGHTYAIWAIRKDNVAFQMFHGERKQETLDEVRAVCKERNLLILNDKELTTT